MPTSPLRSCSEPGCPELVPYGRCAKHTRPAWEPLRPVKRIRGERLQQLRRQLFSRQPLCVRCLTQDPPRYSLATIRDHIVNLKAGGQDIEENTQGLCESCHDAKTVEEAHRWRR